MTPNFRLVRLFHEDLFPMRPFAAVLITLAASTAVASPANSLQSHYLFFPTGTGLPSLSDVAGPPSSARTLNFTNPDNLAAATIVGTGALVGQGTTLGAASTLTVTNAPTGNYSAEGFASLVDTISFANAPIGTMDLRFTYHLDGEFIVPAGFGALVHVQGGLGGAPQGIETSTSQSVSQDFIFTYSVIITGVPANDRFSFLEYLQTAVVSFGLGGGVPLTGSSSASFASTLQLVNFEAFNASNALLPNVVALDSDGAPLFTSSAPEPGTLVFAMAGIAAIAFARRRR
ncbi:MAG: PEP-CTERM sorting domain-containing protein [Candidatus Solibacter sp.]